MFHHAVLAKVSLTKLKLDALQAAKYRRAYRGELRLLPLKAEGQRSYVRKHPHSSAV